MEDDDAEVTLNKVDDEIIVSLCILPLLEILQILKQ